MKTYPFQHRHPTTGVTTSSEGMDLRDHFAGLAMNACMLNSSLPYSEENAATHAKRAYQQADAMLKARESKDEQS